MREGGREGERRDHAHARNRLARKSNTRRVGASIQRQARAPSFQSPGISHGCGCEGHAPFRYTAGRQPSPQSLTGKPEGRGGVALPSGAAAAATTVAVAD